MKDETQRLKITSRSHVRTGNDGVLALNFLFCLVWESNILEMSETQAYPLLHLFLKEFALSQLVAVRDSSQGKDVGNTY